VSSPASLAGRALAEQFAESLDGAVDDVEAILLFGSVARGDASDSSDVDLLVITHHRYRRSLAPVAFVPGISPVFHTWESLATARREDWSFLVHLREEGEVLRRRNDRIERELDNISPPATPEVRASLEADLQYLRRYDDLRRFGDSFKFPLSRLFTLAKRVCMQDNTSAGAIAFDRESAFATFADRHPSLQRDVDRIAELWPFAARTQGRRPQLPPGLESADGLRASASSVSRIVQAALRD